MANIINYINNYGDKNFKEEELNILDISIISILSYLNFDGILRPDRSVKLGDAVSIFFDRYTKKELSNHGLGLKDSYKIAEAIKDKKRFKDLDLYNYYYITNHDIQFSAMFIDINKYLTIISIEGTDDEIAGWKEDFELSYKYPIPAQRECIRYLNENINLFNDRKYIICGHSKGGNLSLVGAMNLNMLKQHKIKKVYSFDGPGLRKNEYNSYKYKYISNKLINIVPNYSIVGLLLNNPDDFMIVKSNKKGLRAHSIYNWSINDKDFDYTDELSSFSIELDKTITKWIDNYDDDTRKIFVTDLFSIFDRCNITSLERIHAADIKAIMMVVKESSNISTTTKDMIKDFINILINIIKEDKFTFVKSKED